MPIVKCRICFKEFYVKPSHQKLGWGKYCSIQCRKKSQFNGKTIKCFNCGKQIYRAASLIKRAKSEKYFCTKSCQTSWRNNYFIEEKSVNWKCGEKTYRNILLRSSRIKRCENCWIKDFRVLVVHHKDRNRKNNQLQNLIWLCLNCHFIEHNRGKI